MPRLLVIRLFLSAAVVLCFVRVIWALLGSYGGGGSLPFDVKPDPQKHAYVLTLRPGERLPPALSDGQVIDIGHMQPADREMLLHPSWIEPGTRFTLMVKRNGQTVPVAMAVRPSLPPVETRLSEVHNATGAILLVFVLAMALLTLWRGRDGTAWGLFSLSCGVLLLNIFQTFGFSPFFGFLMRQVYLMTALVVINPSLYVMAESLTAAGLPKVWRRGARLAIACLALASAALQIASDAGVVYGGSLPPVPQELIQVADVLIIPVVLLPLLVLIIGYGRASHESRLRIRWVFWCSGLLVGGGVAQAVMSASAHPILLFLSDTVLPGLGMLGYLYAILRTRVVDVAFVVDRAVLFSVITAILFGVFALLEEVLDHFAVGQQLGWILQALTAVVLAAALSPLHRLLDRGLERVFFHDLRETVGALRRFAAQSAFFENEEPLLSRALKQLLVPCSAAAIYERNGVIFQRRASHGDGWPERVDVDDPMLVALRAEHQELDVRSVQSAVAREGRAFPMIIGQTLTGAVVCRPRDGEQLDREVRAAIAELARSLCTSLYLLRYREQARLIAEIAAGHVDQAAARSRAAALVAAV